MRILAWEYVTAGGWREWANASSLIAEGAVMVRALAGDLARVSDIEVVVVRDSDIALGKLPAEVAMVDPRDLRGSWRRVIAGCDAVWPIAPETDGVLEEATRLAREEGRLVLNTGGEALAIACSKRATAEYLAAHGVPIAATVGLGDKLPHAENGWVIKPDDGAGAVDTHLFRERAALERWRDRHGNGNFVVQPFVPGTPLSLSLLAQDGSCWLLSCNRQHVTSDNGRFAYRGGIVAGAEMRRTALEPLARRIAAALPDLWGYVGIDLIDSPDGPVVIEINPRLTTSYVGLGESIGINPAGLVLALLDQPLDALVRPLAPRTVEIGVPGT